MQTQLPIELVSLDGKSSLGVVGGSAAWGTDNEQLRSGGHIAAWTDAATSGLSLPLIFASVLVAIDVALVMVQGWLYGERVSSCLL